MSLPTSFVHQLIVSSALLLSYRRLSLIKLLEVSVIVIYCSVQHGHFRLDFPGGALASRADRSSALC